MAARNENDRPVHLDINVSSGVTTTTPITDEEWDAMDLAAQAAADAHSQLVESDRALRNAIAGHPDPVVQALAKRAGLA